MSEKIDDSIDDEPNVWVWRDKLSVVLKDVLGGVPEWLKGLPC